MVELLGTGIGAKLSKLRTHSLVQVRMGDLVVRAQVLFEEDGLGLA